MSKLITTFDVLAVSWIVCYAIVYIAHTKGKGVCQKDESEKLSREQYDMVILFGVLRSKTFKYRSKCHGYWYKFYLNFQLLSTFKVFISTYLNIYALIEVKPDIDGSDTMWYVSIIWGYLLGLGVLFYRIHRLVIHYPFICPINMNHEAFDNKILPYLVWNNQTGALSSCAIEFINTFVGYIVTRQNPTTSITLLVITAMSFSLIFSIKNAYAQCKFFWRARKCVYGLDFGLNEQTSNRYNDFVRLEKMYLNALQKSKKTCGLRYITTIFLYGLWWTIYLIVWAICTSCSYGAHYDMCDIFHFEVWIWSTMIGLLTLPFAPIIAYGGFYLKWTRYLAKSWLFVCCISMIIFGGIYVGENKTDENVEIYITAISLIIIGCCCCCVFCCMMYSDWSGTSNHQLNNENDANDLLFPTRAPNYQTTNSDEMIKLNEILKQLESNAESH